MYEYHLLKWTYTPADFFEWPIAWAATGCAIKIENGQVEARIESVHPPEDSLRSDLQKELNGRFQAVQLLTHKKFSLSQSSLTSVDDDGRPHHKLSASCEAVLKIKDFADVVKCNADGKVISDSKKERQIKQQSFAELVAKLSPANPVAVAILKSYSTAVNDPPNELIYLYEVKDALARHYGGEGPAIAATGVSANRWRRLRSLANVEPLTQGRHRGAKIGSLRDATEEELAEARKITRELIEGFLRHLDGLPPVQPAPENSAG